MRLLTVEDGRGGGCTCKVVYNSTTLTIVCLRLLQGC